MDQSKRKAIVDILKREVSGLRAIYLFGSYARGDFSAQSDVDLAVLTEEKITPEQAIAAKFQLSEALKKDVDLVDLLRANSVTKMQVIEDGDILFAADSKFIGFFETAALSEYANLQIERRGILEDIKKRGRIYD